jgi:hypothetical protein
MGTSLPAPDFCFASSICRTLSNSSSNGPFNPGVFQGEFLQLIYQNGGDYQPGKPFVARELRRGRLLEQQAVVLILRAGTRTKKPGEM